MEDWVTLYSAIVAGNATVLAPLEIFFILIVWDIRRRVIKALTGGFGLEIVDKTPKPPEKKGWKWPW